MCYNMLFCLPKAERFFFFFSSYYSEFIIFSLYALCASEKKKCAEGQLQNRVCNAAWNARDSTTALLTDKRLTCKWSHWQRNRKFVLDDSFFNVSLLLSFILISRAERTGGWRVKRLHQDVTSLYTFSLAGRVCKCSWYHKGHAKVLKRLECGRQPVRVSRAWERAMRKRDDVNEWLQGLCSGRRMWDNVRYVTFDHLEWPLDTKKMPNFSSQHLLLNLSRDSESAKPQIDILITSYKSKI